MGSGADECSSGQIPRPRWTVLVADQGGTIHKYSLRGADRGVFASGLSSPSWITADGNGNIYVSEYTGAKVDKFSRSGELLLTIPTSFTPAGVAIGGDGTIYVAAYEGSGVHHYSPSGADLGLFVSFSDLARADFLAFDGNGYLYVSDFMDGVIRQVSPAGVDLGNFVSGLGGHGFQGPEGLAFDAAGNLYVAVYNTTNVKKFSPSGADLGTFATVGLNSYGIAFNKRGNLYVADYGGTIRRFLTQGKLSGNWASNFGSRAVVIAKIP